MPKPQRSRRSSMQVWPRVRAKREYARISYSAPSKDAKLMGFAGYKTGMTHIIVTDGNKTSMTKGEDISMPVTIVECPPIKIIGIRFYKKQYLWKQPSTQIMAKPDKELARKLCGQKKDHAAKLDAIKPEEFEDLRVIVQTQPKMTGIGKKTPEVFEMAVGGSKEDKLKFAKEHLGKEVSVKDVFKEGQAIDIRAVTKGKGYQGPVKRFGIRIRHHKSEKTKRGPGAVAGGWSAQGQTMYRVAHAGQMGYHTRVDYNKKIMMIGDKPEQVNPNGGFVRYGNVKTTYLLLKGSLPGPTKRMLRLETPIRPNKKQESSIYTLQEISTDSKQGN